MHPVNTYWWSTRQSVVRQEMTKTRLFSKRTRWFCYHKYIYGHCAQWPVRFNTICFARPLNLTGWRTFMQIELSGFQVKPSANPNCQNNARMAHTGLRCLLFIQIEWIKRIARNPFLLTSSPVATWFVHPKLITWTDQILTWGAMFPYT